MPSGSFDDLLHLIEPMMPRRARDALAKGGARLERYREIIQCDRPDKLALANADNIVRAMKDVHCPTDADDCGETNAAVLPRFRLRH